MFTKNRPALSLITSDRWMCSVWVCGLVSARDPWTPIGFWPRAVNVDWLVPHSFACDRSCNEGPPLDISLQMTIVTLNNYSYSTLTIKLLKLNLLHHGFLSCKLFNSFSATLSLSLFLFSLSCFCFSFSLCALFAPFLSVPQTFLILLLRRPTLPSLASSLMNYMAVQSQNWEEFTYSFTLSWLPQILFSRRGSRCKLGRCPKMLLDAYSQV